MAAAGQKRPNPALYCHDPRVPGERSVIFIRGYWTGTDRDAARAATYVAALRGCGWRGGIYQYRWDAGNLSSVLGPVLAKISARLGIAVMARLLRAPVGRSALVPTEVADFYHDWVRAYTRAQTLGEQLFLPAIQAEFGEEPVTIIGHSLGGRLAHYALRSAATSGYRFENAVILGGAHPRHDSGWAEAVQGVHGRIYNVHHAGDAVLKFLYRLGVGTTRSPCGLKPIRPALRGVRNIDAARWLDVYRNSHNRHVDHLPALLGTRTCQFLLGDPDSNQLPGS